MKSSDGLVAGDPINDQSGFAPRSRSTFNNDELSYRFFNTNRFGEIAPFFVMEGLNGDKNVSLLSGQTVDSYTLKAPLMQDVKLKKDLFLVPREAILPLNWEKFFTNPVVGDDVPDDCGSTVERFWYKVSSICNGFFQDISDGQALDTDGVDPLDALTSGLRALVFFEYFYSNGSLLSSLGCHGSKFFRCYETGTSPLFKYSYDTFFDKCCAFVSQYDFQITLNNDLYLVSDRLASDNHNGLTGYGSIITFREFLDLIRDDLSFVVSSNSDSLGLDTNPYPVSSEGSNVYTFADYLAQYNIEFIGEDTLEEPLEDPLDLARLYAYQLVCHHFYSNDHVDYIYSANLFREYVSYLLNEVEVKTNTDQFTCNGLKYFYDVFSAHNFNLVFTASNASLSDLDFLAYVSSIFSYRHSLRYVDYFVGSRTRPLAVGNTEVDVNPLTDTVNVVDVTRNIQKQRFLNAVNRVGRKISDYVKLLSGTSMAPDFHNPLYLGHTSDTVFGDRSEYTGNVSDSEQNNVTSVLKSSGSRYQFTWNCDRECIIIGVQYYDISRVYSNSIERQFFHVNRFDMFNPFMQYIGDQKVYRPEISPDPRWNMSGAFGYQTRNMEYKQRYDQAAGGFVECLPSWLFLADEGFRQYEDSQSPTFIRSFNSEFDRFYVSLTGYSLGTYFHFIVKSINEVSANRPMSATPGILQ